MNKNGDKEAFNGPVLWPGKRINNLCYADDLMSFILTNKQINTAIVTFQEHVDSLKNKMQKKYLNLNVKKSGWTIFPYLYDPTGESTRKTTTYV